MMEKIFPKCGSYSNRCYIVDGVRVRVFVDLTDGDCCAPEEKLGSFLWEFELPGADAAKAFSEDLYYGEYTGA